jgi:hypothetical protein
MRRSTILLGLSLLTRAAQAQSAPEVPGPKQQYQTEQKSLGRAFGAYFYPRYSRLYAAPPAVFVARIDSVRRVFDGLVERYAPRLEARFVAQQRTENAYYFDRLLLDYPDTHHTYTGQAVSLPKDVVRRLRQHQADFDNPGCSPTTTSSSTSKAYLRLQVRQELRKPAYARQDNQWLQPPGRCCRSWYATSSAGSIGSSTTCTGTSTTTA